MLQEAVIAPLTPSSLVSFRKKKKLFDVCISAVLHLDNTKFLTKGRSLKDNRIP